MQHHLVKPNNGRCFIFVGNMGDSTKPRVQLTVTLPTPIEGTPTRGSIWRSHANRGFLQTVAFPNSRSFIEWIW